MNCKQIRELRLMKEMTLDELSEKSGVSKSYLSVLERGKINNPSLRILIQISNALDVDIDQFVRPLPSLK